MIKKAYQGITLGLGLAPMTVLWVGKVVNR